MKTKNGKNLTGKEIATLLKGCNEMLDKYNIKRIGLFGSFAAGKSNEKSDIDLLVEFKKTIDLFEYVHLINELKKIFKTKVDLVTTDALKPYIKNKILREVNWLERT